MSNIILFVLFTFISFFVVFFTVLWFIELIKSIKSKYFDLISPIIMLTACFIVSIMSFAASIHFFKILF